MRCRYCGKEAALLKRLTGGGEFCSEAHKQSYQDEYNRLALSRLLQAQKISQAESTAKKIGTPQPTPVAVEERGAEGFSPEEHTPNGSAAASAPLEISSLEGSVAEEPAAPEAPSETEAEPLEMAGFLVESLVTAAWPEETPYLEPWLELTSGPAVADCPFQNEGPMLSTGELVSLNLQPNASPAEHHVAQASFTPQEFGGGHSEPSLPRKVTALHQLPSAGPIAIEVIPSTIDFATDESTARELDFETFVLAEDSRLLDLPRTAIEFPAADARVEVALGPDRSAAIDSAESEAALEDDSPRASLEALARLHQDLVHQEEIQKESSPEVAEPEPAAAEDRTAPPAEAVQVAAEVAEEVGPTTGEAAPPSGEKTPGRATELLDVSIRLFPPAKPAPVAGVGLPSQSEVLLPNLKSLPLRPKMAVAAGYAPPSTTPAQPKASASAPPAATKDSRPAGPSKPAPAVRPAARIAQPKQPAATPVKAVGSAKSPEAPKQASKVQLPQATVAKTAPPSPVKPESQSAKTETAEPVTSATAGKEPTTGASVKPAGQAAQPVVEEPPGEIATPAAKQSAKQPVGERDSTSVPNFGASQLASPSFAGSLKVKLGIAIVLLIGACSFWLGWGGKSLKPASSAAISADGSGPSIIMGEGGWVEGWGGDPSGMHAGRQITIYRPSLKLTDYRVEFQANIETQSIGWVFRAADPDNYYALKLVTVSSGLSPKVALFKYLVLNGRQTQVGRVPIDLTVQADTVFKIRTDVRGPQFSTYIQGRQVDVWTDDQLKAGGVGFLNEREERGKVNSVSIRYLNGAAK